MLTRPNSEGLSLLEEAIRNAGVTGSALESLTHAYEVINNNEGNVDALYDTIELADECINGAIYQVEEISEEIDDFYNKADENISVEDFFLQVSETVSNVIQKINDSIEKYVYKRDSMGSSNIQSQKDEMKKMISLGYRFNCPLSREIQADHDKMITENNFKEQKDLFKKETSHDGKSSERVCLFLYLKLKE